MKELSRTQKAVLIEMIMECGPVNILNQIAFSCRTIGNSLYDENQCAYWKAFSSAIDKTTEQMKDLDNSNKEE